MQTKIRTGQIRQGDVLLIPVQKIPADATIDAKTKNGLPVLAYGEVSGHAHMLELDEPKNIRYVATPVGKRFIEMLKKTLTINLKHGNLMPNGIQPNTHDHSAILVTEGRMQQGFQVEDYGQEIRPVSD